MAYDFGAAFDDDLLRLDERFTVAMYFIIEFLARRRTLCGPESLCFMNQYMTVGSEFGAFRVHRSAADAETRPPADVMQREDAEFKALAVDYSPDNSIDVVLERFWEKVKSKSAAV